MERKPACSSDANSDARRGERAGGTEYMEKDLTSGSVLKNIFTFSLPYLLSYFLQTLYGICCVLGVAEALAVWAAGLADIEGALALLIIGVVFGVVYGAYAMFWMAETLPRYYDENRICNFAQGAFHIHIPGIYYNNRNWKHVLRAFRVWSMVSLVLVPPCTAGAVFVERATGWQVWGAVLVVYIASLFGAIVIPAKRFE